MDLDTESSGKAVAPMDLDSVSTKSSPPTPIIEEERIGRCDPVVTKISEHPKLKDLPEQVRFFLANSSKVSIRELECSWSALEFLTKDDLAAVKELVLKMSKSIGEDASALHDHVIPPVQPCLLNDEIIDDVLFGHFFFEYKMETVMMHQRKLKLKNKADDQGACSVTKFHQSDYDQMLEKKATEKGFPDFVW